MLFQCNKNFYKLELFVGNYNNDIKVGKRTLYYERSKIYDGNFVNGNLSGKYLSLARTVFRNGTTFYSSSNLEYQYYYGYGLWINKGLDAEIRIGVHNKLVNERTTTISVEQLLEENIIKNR